MAAGRWRCSDVALSSSAQGPRPATQTRPSSSVSALAVAAFGPAVGSGTYRVRPGNSRAACASKLVPLRDAFGCTAWRRAAATGSTAAHTAAASQSMDGRAMSQSMDSRVTSSSAPGSSLPCGTHGACSWWHIAACRWYQLRCRLEQQRTRTETSDADTTIFVGVSALAAAAFGPAVGPAAYRVRPGNSRAAGIETSAAAMCLWLHRLL